MPAPGSIRGQTRDLVGAADKRTRTYGDRARLIAISTPLDALSEIDTRVREAQYLLEYYLPCPKCGAWQPLDFSHIRFEPPTAEIRADRRAWASWVSEDLNHATYECRHCQARWMEHQQPAILQRGRWCTSSRQDKDGQTVGACGVDEYGKPRPTDAKAGVIFDAEALPRFPRGSTIGMRIRAAYSILGVTLSKIAAEFIRAQGDRGKMFIFTTETEGLVFEQQLARVDETIFRDKVARAKTPEGVVPAWTGRLLAAVDTQIDHFVVVIRAWAPNFLSQRVWHGVVGTFAELEALCFATPWACEDPLCGPMVCELVGIDSGGTTDEGADSSRTMEVYRWAQKHKARVRALKGFEASRTGGFLWLGRGLLAENTQGGAKRKREVPLWCLAKHHWQSVLHDYIHSGTKGARHGAEEKELWLLNQKPDIRYEKELANAQQVIERGGTRPVQIWKPIHPGGRWDYRDAEVYQCVLASLARVDLLPQAEHLVEVKRQMWAQSIAARQAAAATPHAEEKGTRVNTGNKPWI